MKYSRPLHFHKFVMQLSEPKWDGGSAEYSFWVLCWSQWQTYALRAPVSRRVTLAWVSPSAHPMNDEWLNVHMCARPLFSICEGGRRGFPFCALKARLAQGWLEDVDVSRKVWAFIQHKRHVWIQGCPMSLLFLYIMDILCFNLRMFPRSMEK